MNEEPTSEGKWLIALMAGVLFTVLASPFAFNISQKLIGKPLGINLMSTNGPSVFGLLIHGAVYALVLRLMLIN